MWFFFRKFKKAQKLDVGQSFVIFLYRDMRANQKEVWGGQKKQKKFKYKVKKRILRDRVHGYLQLIGDCERSEIEKLR